MSSPWPERLRQPNWTPLLEWPGIIGGAAQEGRVTGAETGGRIAGEPGAAIGAAVGTVIGGALGGLGLAARPLNFLAEETERLLGAFSLVAARPEARREIASAAEEIHLAQASGDPARIEQARQREIQVSQRFPRNPADIYRLVTDPSPAVRIQAFELPARAIEGVARAAAARPGEWRQALQSADVGAYTPGLIERAWVRINVNGEDPEEVAADLIPQQNIWAQLIGQTALDPLNVIQLAGAARWLRQSRRVSHAKNWFLKADPRPVPEVLAAMGRNMSPAGTAGFVRRVNPFALTTEAQKTRVLEDAALIMQGVTWNGRTADEKLALLNRWASDLSDEGLERFAQETGMRAVVSTPGKRAAGIFQAMGDGEGPVAAFNRAMATAQRAGLESPDLERRALELFVGDAANVFNTMFPITPSIYEQVATPILRVRRPLDNLLATMFMGVNPAFTMRNVSNSIVTELVDGWWPFHGAAKKNLFFERFGAMPRAAARGVTAAERPADTRIWNLSLRASQDMERWAAQNIVYEAMNDVIRKTWPRRVREVVDALPDLAGDQRRYLTSRLYTALNSDEIDDVLRGLAGGAGPHFDPDAVSDAMRFSGMADELTRLAANTPNPTAFRTNAVAQMRQEIQRLRRQASGAPLVRGEPLADAMMDLMAQYPRAARDERWFYQLVAGGFENAEAARRFLWQAADTPEKHRLARLYEEWSQRTRDYAFGPDLSGDRRSMEIALYNQRAIDWARDLYRQFTGQDMPIERFQVILGPIGRPVDDLLRGVRHTNPRLDALDDAAGAGQRLIDSVAYPVTPRTGLDEWAQGLKANLNDVKLVAAHVGAAARDFALLDYRQRRGIDSLISMFVLFPYWASRTYPNWVTRFITNPGVIASYLRFREALRKINADAPEWLQGSLNLETVGLPAPLYISVESMINPMQGLITTFDDAERRQTTLGELIHLIDQAGFSAHIVFPWMYAVERALAGDEEAAIATVGHLASATRAIKYATGLAGIGPPGGITLEPWLWRGQPFLGGDKWAYRRATRQLAGMEQTGEITPTEARAAARAMSLSDATNPHVREAIKREAKQRGWPTLVAYTIGPGIRYVSEEDQEVDRAFGVQADMFARRAEMSDDEWTAAWTDFYAQFPFMRTLSLSRRDRERADDAWVYDVMARIPPGARMATAEEHGIPRDLMSRFYEDRGLENFVPHERMRLMAGILEMAEKYDVPTPKMSAEWAEVSRRLSEMNRLARERWPNIDELTAGYYTAKEQGLQREYLEQNPSLKQYWDWRDAYRANDPVLRFYATGTPRQQAISTIWDIYMGSSSAQKRAIRSALGRSFGAFLNKNYAAVRDEELFTWVTYLGSMPVAAAGTPDQAAPRQAAPDQRTTAITDWVVRRPVPRRR